jgi:two-component system NtrC family response regulator/two-component system response regulator HydG
VVTIHLPPLRERRSDIPLLADYFIKSYAEKMKKNVTGLTEDALACMMRYPWPGNVRELSNAMERAVIFTKKPVISIADLSESIRTIPTPAEEEGFDLMLDSPSLARAEIKLISKVLEDQRWNMKQAADKLGIARGTLYGKMERYGIRKPD